MNDSIVQHLVLMKGFPATGKSALAHRLSQQLRWPLIDKDDVKDHTLGLENANEMAYDILWSVTGRQLEMGLSVIVDSPLSYPQAFEAGRSLAYEYGAKLLVIETQLDDNTWRQRFEDRDRSESAHKISSWQEMDAMLDQYDGCWRYAIPGENHLVVDAAQPLDTLVDMAVRRLHDKLAI